MRRSPSAICTRARPVVRAGGRVLLALWLATQASAQAAPPVLESMGELCARMRAIEDAPEGDHAAVRAAAHGIVAEAERLARSEGAGHGVPRDDFAWHGARLHEAAGALASASDAADGVRVRDALRGLRAACTACHVQHVLAGTVAGSRAQPVEPPAAPGLAVPLRSAPDPARAAGASAWPCVGDGAIVFGRIQVSTASGEPRTRVDDVVVFADGLPASPAPPGTRAAIVQRDRAFHPEILVVRVGTVVDFPNHDAVFHNIFSLSKTQPFDHGLYGRGESRHQRFDRPGLVKIYCNIHPEMVAHVLVLQNPHALRVTPSGFYCLAGLPAGPLTLRAWSELGVEVNVRLEVEEGAVLRQDLAMQEHGKRAPHRNKFGRPYREKY